MINLGRIALACLIAALTTGTALAAEPIMTLNVAVNISNLPGEVQQFMVNCVVTSASGGIFADGSTSGAVVHSATGNGTYVGSFNGRTLVQLYQSGPGQVGNPQNGYQCSLALVAGGKICAPANGCLGNGPWSDHKPGTAFTPVIGGVLPPAN